MTDVPPLSRESALKIALAARLLPDIGVVKLIEILHRRLGTELTEEALKTITVTDLKTGFASVDGEEDGEDIGIGLPALKEAVRVLWGEEEVEKLPDTVPYDPSIEGAIRVAVASNSGEELNGHFGSCIRYLVYQLSPETLELVDIRSALEADFSDDRNAFRANLIKDCQILYVISIGGPAAAKVGRVGIYPMKIEDGGAARDTLKNLQKVMLNPPPWLAKIVGVNANSLDKFREQSA